MRSDRMMMLTPSRTAPSARAQSSSSTWSMPAAPSPAWKVVSSVRDLKWLSAMSPIERIFSRSASVRIGWRTSSRLVEARPLQVEQVRPRPDDRDEAHHELLADRVDRRVGDLREILLEIGEELLRPVRQRRDRRVVAHRARRFLAGGGHRRHQDGDVFLACSRTPAADRAAAGWSARPWPARPAIPRARSGCGRATRDRDGSWRAAP